MNEKIIPSSLSNDLDEPWPIAVFAHNEAHHIVHCLESLVRGANGHPIRCFVLVNGCKDDTEKVVAEYAKTHPYVQLVSISLGDKSNAWNEYAHLNAPASDIHFFVDGDVTVSENSLVALYNDLKKNPQANAAAAFPLTGRSRKLAQREIAKGGELSGNLYALSGKFLQAMKSEGIRLPVGLIGDDTLIGALASWDLDPNGKWDSTRVISSPGAAFKFPSLSIFGFAHWRLYYRRRIRYRIRAYQIAMLRPILKQRGISAMPAHVKDLYSESLHQCRLKPNGINTFFDWLALRIMRRQINLG